MKLFIKTIILLIPLNSLACIDFEGTWEGACSRNGHRFKSKTLISQSSCESIEINGISYFVGKPTVEVREYSKEKRRYKEVSVYNMRWNDTQDKLFINLRWLGWYLNHPKTWSGGAGGYLKLKGPYLYSFRKFSSGKEKCRYKKINTDQ